MSAVLKIGLSSLGIIVAAAGGGLIGSNYAFDKTIHVELPQYGNDNAWDEKLVVLLRKMKNDSELTSKIDSNPSVVFALKGPNNEEFNEKDKARDALKRWCEQGLVFKKVSAKDEAELCKSPKKAGWLLGDQRD